MRNGLKINLLHEPKEIGFKIFDAGFIYELVEVRPHRTKLGEESLVTTWKGECGNGGHEFRFQLGAAIYNLPRRCKVHAKGQGFSKVTPFYKHGRAEADLDASNLAPDTPLVRELRARVKLLEALLDENDIDIPGAVSPKPEMTEAEILEVRKYLFEVGRKAREERLAEIAAEQAALKPSHEDLLS